LEELEALNDVLCGRVVGVKLGRLDAGGAVDLLRSVDPVYVCWDCWYAAGVAATVVEAVDDAIVDAADEAASVASAIGAAVERAAALVTAGLPAASADPCEAVGAEEQPVVQDAPSTSAPASVFNVPDETFEMSDEAALAGMDAVMTTEPAATARETCSGLQLDA
jgi:cell division septation protein DedD